MSTERRTVGLLGATGSVGRLILERLVHLGHVVVAQSRSELTRPPSDDVRPAIFDPGETDGYDGFASRCEAVIWALGVSRPGATRMFSDGTRALIAAMQRHGVARLIAITGVGAGETRGHGGFVYNRLVYPLITRRIYEDKDRQEALITASDLDWTILRPAPFTTKTPAGTIQVHTSVPADLQLRAIRREDVAEFAVRTLTEGLHSRQKVFFGHA